MLLEFKITNFRSIKEEQILSCLPSSKVKDRLNGVVKVSNYKNLELLKSCVVYGPNNSGKSNLLSAFRALRFLVANSHEFNVGKELSPNEAFHFDTATQRKPTIFQIDFIAKDGIRYDYKVSFDKIKIHEESLYFYPNPDSNKLKPSKLYTRKEGEFSYGELFRGEKKSVESRLLNNQLFLSKAVLDKVDQLNPTFEYLSEDIALSIYHDTDYEEMLLRDLGKFIFNNKENEITSLIEQFIINSDAGIIGIKVSASDDIPQIQFPDDFPKEKIAELKKELLERFQFQIQTEHRLYEDGKEAGVITLPLKEQSTGTKKFLSMLRNVFVVLKEGDLLVVDELDKSLHTEWTQLLISLFHDSGTNPNNAQLIFATHDTNLISSELFDRDQIYMIEKDRFGASQLFALSSYTGLRKSTPYEKWYLSGRFGAVPNVRTNLLTSKLRNSSIYESSKE